MFSTAPSPSGRIVTDSAEPACGAPASATDTRVELSEVPESDRAPIEAFIRRRFSEVYGASIRSFMPRLFGLRDAQGDLIAAFGMRSAGSERLFLERYLDEPVEAVIKQHFDMTAAREHIVEVGNLAGATPGALRRLIPGLTDLLFRQQFQWLSFTGAAHLCNGFTRVGLPLHVVAAASVERLPPEERVLWGSYYDRSPSVMLGNVQIGKRRLREISVTPRALKPVAGVGLP